MSLLGSINQRIEIKLYYKESKSKGYSKIIVIPDDEAEKLMQEQEEVIKKKTDAGERVVDEDRPIKILTTEWVILKWGDQTQISAQSQRPPSPDGAASIDYVRFRDLRVKKCLCDWDVVDEKGIKVPLTPKTIDMLPSDIVMSLLSKYDEVTSIDEDETEKN